MKKALSLALAAIVLACCLSACGGKDDGATTTAAPETTTKSNIPTVPAEVYTGSAEITPIAPAESAEEVDLVYEDYFYYGNTVGQITNVTLEENAPSGILGLADVRILALDTHDSELKIGYTAYDKDGNVVRDLFLLVNLTEASVKEGAIVADRRFDLPEGTVKVVFHSYTEK